MADPTLTDEELAEIERRYDPLNRRSYDSDVPRLIAALRASREDLRIANEAGLALLATAAELTREIERLNVDLDQLCGGDL